MSAQLLHTPLFGIALTLIIFQFASLFYRRFRYTLFNPVILTIIAIIVLLKATGIPYSDYALGGDMILFLLGPAVVALGVPLYQRRSEISQRLLPIAGGIIAGAT
ncbi:MAG: CidB/LrgB family autolysis modulator, partial [Desulfuromonas sp.]